MKKKKVVAVTRPFELIRGFLSFKTIMSNRFLRNQYYKYLLEKGYAIKAP